MRTRRIWPILAVLFIGLLSWSALSETASAQNPWSQYPRNRREYVPGGNRPALSPYFNLFRNDGSFNFNYQTLVRPQFQQMGVNSAQRRYNQQQTTDVGALQGQVGALQGEMRSVVSALQRANIRPTGNAGSFMNLSHYYSGRR
jgi:hypothetical protein